MVIRLIGLCIFLCLLTSCETQKTTEYKVADKTTLLGNQTSCEFKNLNLPKDIVIYATGDYKGRELNSYIDKSRNKATQFDVIINSPKKPVALILSAYEPSIWNIGWTKNTKILAIVATGYHRQALAGITEDTPIIISTYDNKNECGYAYISSSDKSQIQELSKKIFKREPNAVLLSNKGTTIIGDTINIKERLIQSNYITLKDILDNDIYIVGKAKLEKEEKSGNIRKATQNDVDEWLQRYTALLENKNREITLPGIMRNGTNTVIDDGFGRRQFNIESIYNGYVIEKEFTFPDQLTGTNSATFFLKKGVPYPNGDPGHSTVFDFNNMTCTGFECEKNIFEKSNPALNQIIRQ